MSEFDQTCEEQCCADAQSVPAYKWNGELRYT
jgi:hypothetical protein